MIVANETADDAEAGDLKSNFWMTNRSALSAPCGGPRKASPSGNSIAVLVL